MIVGWYHSHPNLGVFFSDTDRATQSTFFNNLYALGLVIDPVRIDRKCFFGAASDELEKQAITIYCRAHRPRRVRISPSAPI